MPQTMPVGDIVKLMDKGVVTLPSKYRGLLQIKKGELLNVFEWEGVIVIAPIDVSPKSKTSQQATPPDWSMHTPRQYLKQVRCSMLEKMWVKRSQGRW